MVNPIFLVASLFSMLFLSGLRVAIASDQGMERAKGEESYSTKLKPVMRQELLARGGDPFWIEEAMRREYLPTYRFTDGDFSSGEDSLDRSQALPAHPRRYFHLEFDDPIYQRLELFQRIRPWENPEKLFLSAPRSSEEKGSDPRYTLLKEEEKAHSGKGKNKAGEPHRDWAGLGRDTAFFMGYEAFFVGVLYLLPEDVTSWTKDQKRASLSKWWENVQNPVWDKDKWWINYVFHPYFGGTYYIRARERGFGDFGSFWYSALLSSLYEFGAESFYEPPSYQDLIVTPVGGYLVGKYIFEPIRERVKAKPELRWYDHLTLILTDPLGAVNSVFERLLGIESDIRVQLRPPVPLQCSELNPCSATSLKEQYGKHLHQHGISLELNLVWH